jgi:hypothetical protein
MNVTPVRPSGHGTADGDDAHGEATPRVGAAGGARGGLGTGDSPCACRALECPRCRRRGDRAATPSVGRGSLADSPTLRRDRHRRPGDAAESGAEGSRGPGRDGGAHRGPGDVAAARGPQPLDDPPARQGRRAHERLRVRGAAAARPQAAPGAHVQGEPGSRVRGEGARCRRPLPPSARARGGAQCGRGRRRSNSGGGRRRGETYSLAGPCSPGAKPKPPFYRKRPGPRHYIHRIPKQ